MNGLLVTVVDTTPPSITAPPDVNIEGNTVGGANVVLANLGTATASDIVDSTPTITNDFVADFYALGSITTVTWTATDDSGNSASATQSFTVVDTTPPSITAPSALSVLVNAPSTVLTGTATDIVDPSPTVTNDAPAFFPPGTTIVNWTAIDASGNIVHATTTVTASYNFIGVLQPINSDGSSLFKLGSTIPVKFQLRDYNGNLITNVSEVAKIFVLKVSNTPIGTIIEDPFGELGISTSAATTGNLFRPADDQYIFNLATKTLSAGTYQIRINLIDGSSYYAWISSRK